MDASCILYCLLGNVNVCCAHGGVLLLLSGILGGVSCGIVSGVVVCVFRLSFRVGVVLYLYFGKAMVGYCMAGVLVCMFGLCVVIMVGIVSPRKLWSKDRMLEQPNSN